MLIAGKTARQTYESLLPERQPYLDRARQVAELTLPHLMPPEGYKGGQLPTPYQAMGARGVSSLASKLLLALFPPGQSMMRYQIDPITMDNLSAGEGKIKAEVEASLAMTEKAVSVDIESNALRPRLHEGLKQYVIAGNFLLFNTPSGGLKVFHLDRYVIKRDPEGNPLIIVVKESISKVMLPKEIKGILDQPQEGDGTTGISKDDISQDSVDIYTAVVRTSPTRYATFQEVAGVVVPKSYGVYKADELPWNPIRADAVAGESYSYGYAVGLLGDLATLEGLMKALVDASAASARLVFLVSPNSSTNIRELQQCPNGGFVAGLPDDVVALKVDKAADMSVAFNAIERLQTSLGFSFLLNQSVQRAGERVTAEEIRFLAQELEDVQAGAYSLLAQELQLPLVSARLARLRRERKVPVIPKEVARPSIVTGLEALSRGHDLQKLDALVQGGVAMFGPEVTAQYVKADLYFKRRETALGLSGDSMIRTQEEVDQMTQQAQLAAMAQQIGPNVVNQVGNVAAAAQKK
ncbi:MAG: phage tail protein [Flavobacteriales bacterium]|nr:phage tail protein [Flavobacteriales bacterium]